LPLLILNIFVKENIKVFILNQMLWNLEFMKVKKTI
jgi:hypothetical protein